MWAGHFQWVKEMLQLIRAVGLMANLAKCHQCCTETKYLGYVLSNGKIRPLADKVKALMEFAVPTIKRQMK